MKPFRTIALSLLIVFTLTAYQRSTPAQTTSDASEWETLRPEGEEFGIQMPKNSTAEASKEPYHKMVLNTRLYLWANPTGPVFAVVSMSGIKSNPAMYSEMERVNSYVDAFRRWFAPKVRGKDAVAKLTLVGPKTLNGHAGREYQLTIGNLSGAAQVYATRKRFYAVVALNTKKEEVLHDRFLSSFELPEKLADEAPNIAAQRKEKIEREKLEREKAENPDIPPNFQGQKPDVKPQGSEGSTETPTDVKPESAPPGDEKAAKRAPISGGVLNGKAISLPFPPYPPIARQAKASGTVVVQVTIDEYGNVIAARAVSGHPLLQAAAVAAAREAKFSPTFLMGEAVKVTGVITYNFVAQ
ncbi:MAG: TonB family protein [Pyrinomonadaceae bacterium]